MWISRKRYHNLVTALASLERRINRLENPRQPPLYNGLIRRLAQLEEELINLKKAGGPNAHYH